MKIVINVCHGGFDLSHKAVMRYAELKGIKLYPFIDESYKKIYGEKATVDNPRVLIHYTISPVKEESEMIDEIYFSPRDIPRDNSCLIKVIEELGEEANGLCAKLKIVEIPDDVKWEIEEYDGVEWISEAHRKWR